LGADFTVRAGFRPIPCGRPHSPKRISDGEEHTTFQSRLAFLEVLPEILDESVAGFRPARFRAVEATDSLPTGEDFSLGTVSPSMSRIDYDVPAIERAQQKITNFGNSPGVRLIRRGSALS
jgi:hypothetical protein